MFFNFVFDLQCKVFQLGNIGFIRSICCILMHDGMFCYSRNRSDYLKTTFHCSILHFGSLSLTTEPGKTTTLELVKAAKAMGKCISYDPNWRPALWKSEEKGIAAMKLGLELCHILKISQEELALLMGGGSITQAILDSARELMEEKDRL